MREHDRFYWIWHRRLPVTFHLEKDYRFEWRCVMGIRLGRFFVGVIEGDNIPDGSPPRVSRAGAEPAPCD